MNSKRNSNIELLRIISMFLIVAFHVCINGMNECNQPLPVYFTYVFLGSWGVLGVDLFLIISCWFLTGDQQMKLKKIIDIVFQTFTYVIFYTLFFIIRLYLKNGSITDTFLSYLNYLVIDFFDPFFSRYYWFITSYVFLLICIPFFNRLIGIMKKETHKKILLVFGFIFIYSQFSISPICDTVYFFYIYFLIAYIKKYQVNFNNPLRNAICLILIVIFAQTARYFLYDSGKIAYMIDYILMNTFAATGRNSIIMSLIAINLFLYVINLKPVFNSSINRIASYSLGVYLFHEAEILKLEKPIIILMKNAYRFRLLVEDFRFPLRFILFVFMVYIAGLIFEMFRKKLVHDPFMNWFTVKYSDKIRRIEEWYKTA